MRFIFVLAAILSTASVAYAAIDPGYDPMAAGHVIKGLSVLDALPEASPSRPLLLPFGSDGMADEPAGQVRVCGHARHRLFDECVSALIPYPSPPQTAHVALL